MYYVYITTNLRRNALYIGITNNLGRRLREHYAQKGLAHTFAGKYYCYGLIYVETFSQVEEAISREKELKGWKRSKKIALIETQNSAWTFLNDQYW